jgi:hypothetical protein
MNERAFEISLTAEEGRTVFEALGEQPFKHVFELIGNINKQANEALDRSDTAAPTSSYTFTGKELALIVRALGTMPFERVHELIANLNRQIRDQGSGN